MNVTVGSYYEDKAKGTQREVHVTLSDEDGVRMFPKWEEWSVSTQVSKITAMADVFVLKYAVERGFRDESTVQVEVAKLVQRYLTDD